MELCYVCGWNFKKEYSVGDICPCCRSEYGFHDCLEKGEILEKYCGGDRNKLHIMAPELDEVPDDEYAADDIAWRFLRLSWVKAGCPFKSNGNEKWTLDDAKKQLYVIRYHYDALVPLANKIISD